jgi:osmotically inducible protein OsmC
MRALYTAEVTAHGGREGHVRSSDGILDAAGYAACFESALRLAARSRKKPLQEASITARVTLNLTADKRYLLGVELRGRLEELTEDDALGLMRAAHDVCPYSNATRGNVEVRLLVESDPVAVA